MSARAAWLAWLVVLGGAGGGLRALTRPPAETQPRALRLVEHLAEARRVVQSRQQIEPEAVHLKAGSLAAPPGWKLSEPGPGAQPVVARLVRPGGSGALRLRFDVPVTGGRDVVVRLFARDPAGAAELLIEHAPEPGQPTDRWHRATQSRAGSRVRFDWREDIPEGRSSLALVLEEKAAAELDIESLTVREAGARDPSLLEGAPGAVLHALVERPVEGVAVGGGQRALRLVASLLASGESVYEWRLPRRALTLELETATVPRGAGERAPVEMRVEVEGADGWQTRYQAVRGGAGDGGGWRPARIEISPSARALRLATRARGPLQPMVVAWGNPTLRAPEPAVAERRPHVLLVTLDAVRPDHLSAYGYAKPTSQFLAKLAAEGARFEDVRAQAGHTWASTTSLVSGLLPDTSGVMARGSYPHRGMRGVADAFARAGYVTGRIGHPALPRGQLGGFDFVEMDDLDTDMLSRLVTIARATEHPLFLWIHLHNAHYPFMVRDEFNRFDPGYAGRFAHGLTREQFRELSNSGSMTPREQRHLVALYDGAILQMDAGLGAAMARLDDVGFFKNAVVAVTADHGAHLGEHDIWFLHSTPWHVTLSVPLILFAPGRVPPRTVVGADRGRALLIDLGPTLLDLAGVPAERLDGRSLRPLLTGGRLAPRTTQTRFLPASYVVVETDRYKLLWNPAGEQLEWPGELKLKKPLPRLGLYRPREDPGEVHDLSSAEPLVAAELMPAAEAKSARGQTPVRLSTEARQLLQQAGYADDN